MKKTNYPLLHKKCSVKFTSQIEPNIKIRDSIKVIREPNSRFKETSSYDDTDQCLSKSDENIQKYSKPEMNSCLQYAQRILELEGKCNETKKYCSVDDLTPYEKKIVNRQVSKKISFPPDVQVYKDLIPLDVPTEKIKQFNDRNKTSKIEFRKKDITPKLSDFYTPKTKSEYKVIVDSPILSDAPVRQYNGMALHQKISSWTIEDL